MAKKKETQQKSLVDKDATAETWMPRWWRAYFAAIAENGGFKNRASASVGIDRSTPYQWLADNPEFRDHYDKAMAVAMESAAENLMAEVIRRGQEGIMEPVFYKGRKVGLVRKYSDTLLMFRLNAMGQGTRQSAVSFDASRLFTDEVMDSLSPEHLRRLRDGEDPLSVLALLLSSKASAE